MKKNIFLEILEKQKSKKSIGIYEKRAGGEIVFLYNLHCNDLICLADIQDNWIIGNFKI